MSKNNVKDRLFQKECWVANWDSVIIAFAFNAKSFAIAILVFFIFPSHHLFWTDCQKLFSQCFIISFHESMWPRSDSFLGHIKKSLNIVPQVVIWDVCGTWHDLCAVTNVHSIQKSTRNSQKLGNKLGQLFSGCWQKIQLLKQREIELISKTVWIKRKEKMFRLGIWLLFHVKQYQNCFWRTFVIRKCTYLPIYILLVDDLMMK